MANEKRKPRLTWRKQPSETGLRSVGQGPRGAILSLNGERVASVSSGYVAGFGSARAWFWCVRADEHGIPLRNSAVVGRAHYPDNAEGLEDAKIDCQAYVVKCLAERASR